MMPTEEMDNLEILKQVAKNESEQLLKMKYDDPNRPKQVDAVETVSKLCIAYEQLEQNRLSNNAKNDVEEAKLIIEDKKLENERLKMKHDTKRTWYYMVAALFGTWLSYNLGETTVAYKKMEDAAKSIKEGIMRFVGK